MYKIKTTIVLGFHGCDKKKRDWLIANGEFKPDSPYKLFERKDYDWLGEGMYFWENDPERAYTWAKDVVVADQPVVLGAVLDLGFCLDLSCIENFNLLKDSYENLKIECRLAGKPLPKNYGGPDKKLRKLDCEVINSLHDSRKRDPALRGFDSVRSPFLEGKPPYTKAGFKSETHIQIAIRNPNCIKGFFLPRNKDQNFPDP